MITLTKRCSKPGAPESIGSRNIKPSGLADACIVGA
jgi:hypothetical protein